MASVCVVGLGKLGACLAAVLAIHHDVIGIDVDVKTVKAVNEHEPPVNETGLRDLMRKVKDNFRATVDWKEATKDTSIAFVIVPTPSGEDAQFSNNFVIEAVEMLGSCLPKNGEFFTVVICSTVMPGSTDGPVREALEKASGRKVGDTLGLCYSPEFIALGSVIHDLQNPDVVLVGVSDDRSATALFNVLGVVPDNFPVWCRMSIVDAEVAKLAVNAYVTMKISFFNSLGEICERIDGANASNVAQAISNDGRIGRSYSKPGAPYGGPCFPRDAEAFYALGQTVGAEADLAKATSVINRRQVIDLANQLYDYERVSVLGLSYKPDTDITEKSFGLELVELLQFEGVYCTVYDPKAKISINGNEHPESPQECIDASSVVVVATPWPEFSSLNYEGKLVYDRWGIIPEGKGQIVRFGQG